jgi:lipopolysaccharide transport system permease protein
MSRPGPARDRDTGTQAQPPQWRRHAALCRHLIAQDLALRFTGSLAGLAWTVIAPLAQLAVFYFVFLHILGARVPGLTPDAYLVFLALGFWPWFAFSEAVTRATTAVHDYAGLAAKIALPRAVPVVARVLAAFLIHGVGFLVVLGVIAAAGLHDLHWSGLLPSLALWLPMFALALGVGLLVAALQVFVRDLGQTIGLLMSLWFFLTPIVYVLDMASSGVAAWLVWNPLTAVVEAHRAWMLFGGESVVRGIGVLLGAAVLAPLLGAWVFRRTAPHFEDFL